MNESHVHCWVMPLNRRTDTFSSSWSVRHHLYRAAPAQNLSAERERQRRRTCLPSSPAVPAVQPEHPGRREQPARHHVGGVVNLQVGPRDAHTKYQQNAHCAYEPAVAWQKLPRDEDEREQKGRTHHCMTAGEGVAGGDAQSVEQLWAQAPHKHLCREVEAERSCKAQYQKHRRAPAGSPEPGSDEQAQRTQGVDGTYDVEQESGPRQKGGTTIIQPCQSRAIKSDILLVVRLVGQFSEEIQQGQEQPPVEQILPRGERKASRPALLHCNSSGRHEGGAVVPRGVVSLVTALPKSTGFARHLTCRSTRMTSVRPRLSHVASARTSWRCTHQELNV